MTSLAESFLSVPKRCCLTMHALAVIGTAFAVLSLVAAAPVAAQATPATGAEPTFAINPGVAPEDAVLIRAGVRLAQDAFPTILGAAVLGPVFVGAAATPCEALAAPNGCPPRAQTDGFRIAFNTAHAFWTQAPPLLRLKIVVHEYAHVLEGELAGDYPEGTPGWLWEGTAEYAGYAALVDRGLTTADAVEDYNAWTAIHGAASPVSEPGTADYWAYSASYADAFLRVERLTANRGGQALRDYFVRRGQGDDHATAFAAAFGQSPSAFETAYAAWRAALVAPEYLPGVFAPIGAPHDVNAAISIDVVAGPVATSSEHLLMASTEPEARCMLSLVGANGDVTDPLPAVADSTGAVFWLRPGSDDDMVEVRCGGAPVSVGVAGA